MRGGVGGVAGGSIAAPLEGLPIPSPHPHLCSALASIEASMAGVGGHMEASHTWTDSWLADQLSSAAGRAAAERAGVPWRGEVVRWTGPTSVTATLRVPVERFDAAIAAVRAAIVSAGGAVTSLSSNARDVTSEYVDVVARQHSDELAAKQLEKVRGVTRESALAHGCLPRGALRHLRLPRVCAVRWPRAHPDRSPSRPSPSLPQLMAAAANVHEVLAVKRELDQLQQRIDSSKAQRKSLESRGTMSMINLQLQVPAPSPPPQPSASPRPGWSPLRTAGKAVDALASAGRIGVDVIVYTIILALPVALVGLLAARVARPAIAAASGAIAQRLQTAMRAGGGGAAAQYFPLSAATPPPE